MTICVVSEDVAMQSLLNLPHRTVTQRYIRGLSSLLMLGTLGWSTPALTTEADIVEPATPTTPVEAAPRLSPPTLVLPNPVAAPPTAIRNNLPSKNSYIDSVDLGTTAAQESQPAPAVVLTERKSGCQTVVQNGTLRRGCGASTPALAQRRSVPEASQAYIPPRHQRLSQRTLTARSLISRAPQATPLKPLNWETHRYQAYGVGQPVSPQQVVSLEPIVRRGLAIALAPMPEYNRATSLYAPTAPSVPGQGTDLLFPVASAAPITSAFGWRIHPITGQGRMHSGTDIGAPLGTPVLAAYAGEVALADWSGGYGLMVILRHLQGTQESRYAHLSEILVQPGQQVQQGEIIGRVGSTGLSTGPHLHFEWRHLTNDGWVAVDAGQHLQFALDNLLRAQQVALATPQANR